jgi:hypothetical protein
MGKCVKAEQMYMKITVPILIWLKGFLYYSLQFFCIKGNVPQLFLKLDQTIIFH